MSEQLKEQLVCEIAEDLIKRFDYDVSNEVLAIINKHLYNYDVTEKQNALIELDSKTERILKLFIGTKRLEGKAESTLKQYYREIRLLLGFLNCPIEEVTTSGIKFYLSEMKAERNLQNSTVETMRSYLSAVFSWVANESFIPVNPCARIAPIKTEEKIRKSFSDEELLQIKEACKDNLRDLALINFLYSTGCRISETISVNIKDIDFDKKQLIVLGKGNKERIVYLTDTCCSVLKEYIDSRKDKEEALFISYKRTRLTQSGARNALRRLEYKSGVENIHPHRFRRTLATNLLNKGMPIQDVSKLLGHANVKVTQQYYYHTDKRVEKSYREFMDE